MINNPLDHLPSIKRSKKAEREHRVLIGLVELYLKTGKAIGSHTLKEQGFSDLSSATIRNYFSQLEDAGYLIQQHSSGGRIPTDLAYKIYAKEYLKTTTIEKADEAYLQKLRGNETRELGAYLTSSLEVLSELTGYAAFLSAPRFDHDFIRDFKLIAIDSTRCLCILITDFGLIQTETLYSEKQISNTSLKRIEEYFGLRLKGSQEILHSLTDEELQLGQRFYHEIMVRYLVNYSHFSQEDLYRTGFSKLLLFQEFNDPLILANGLSLFENTEQLSRLLKDRVNQGLSFLIGDDLSHYAPAATHCAVIAIPYCIGQTTVGTAGILGPTRMPYRQLFGILKVFSNYLSESLTKSLYKFKLDFRKAKAGAAYLSKEESLLISQPPPHLLEDKRDPQSSGNHSSV